MRHGQVIQLCVLALLTLGVVMVNSAAMTIDPEGSVTFKSILMSRPSAYMALAVAAMVACSWLPIHRLARPPRPIDAGQRFGPPRLWCCTIALMGLLALVYVPGLSHPVNGSFRWVAIPIPGLPEISFQPSEFVKWAVIPLLAWYGAASGPNLSRMWSGLLPGLVASGVLAGFIVLEDLGTGVLMGTVTAIMLIAAGARLWQFALLAPCAIGAVGAAILSSPYRIDRLTAFIDPYADAGGTGYHVIQSLGAIANGEMAGRGLGHGLQKFGYLPEDTTDFLFAIICEELGVMGALLVLFLYGGLLASVLAVTRGQNAMLRLYGLGVCATIGIQAMINLLVVTGLAPTKGIALPLLSSGGTGWILTAASLGLLAAMETESADDLSGSTADEPECDLADAEPA